MFNTEGTK